MNYKLEKFWNSLNSIAVPVDFKMNYKLEKFWNGAKNYGGSGIGGDEL